MQINTEAQTVTFKSFKYRENSKLFHGIVCRMQQNYLATFHVVSSVQILDKQDYSSPYGDDEEKQGWLWLLCQKERAPILKEKIPVCVNCFNRGMKQLWCVWVGEQGQVPRDSNVIVLLSVAMVTRQGESTEGIAITKRGYGHMVLHWMPSQPQTD